METFIKQSLDYIKAHGYRGEAGLLALSEKDLKGLMGDHYGAFGVTHVLFTHPLGDFKFQANETIPEGSVVVQLGGRLFYFTKE